MKHAVIFLLFISSASLKAQVKLYGHYMAGDSKEAVAKLEQKTRLNGMYYFIEPYFNARNQLYKIRMVNHDYVVLSDYHVVLKHAERLVELLRYFNGPADRINLEKEPVKCGIDTPYEIIYQKLPGKDIRIDIECNESFYYIVFTITAHDLAADNLSRFIGEVAEIAEP